MVSSECCGLRVGLKLLNTQLWRDHPQAYLWRDHPQAPRLALGVGHRSHAWKLRHTAGRGAEAGARGGMRQGVAQVRGRCVRRHRHEA